MFHGHFLRRKAILHQQSGEELDRKDSLVLLVLLALRGLLVLLALQEELGMSHHHN